MKTCPRCNFEVQEEQTKCPICDVVFAQWAAAHASSSTDIRSDISMSENEQDQRLNSVSQTDKTSKQKYWGLVLVALGLVFEILRFAAPGLLIVGMVICGIGLAYYAKSRGRSVAWSAFALWPIAGAFLGLLVLAVKPMSAAQIFGWLAVLVLIMGFYAIATMRAKTTAFKFCSRFTVGGSFEQAAAAAMSDPDAGGDKINRLYKGEKGEDTVLFWYYGAPSSGYRCKIEGIDGKITKVHYYPDD